MFEMRDCDLLQIVDAALAEAARRSGPWLVCRPGCTQCCHGPFPIDALDADRLQRGLRALDGMDGKRAERIRERALDYVARLRDQFPGNPATGVLDESPEAEVRFAEFANDEPCPALDPQSGTCDVYTFRPMTCRTFGPPIRCGEESVGVCELCYHGASDEEIAACGVEADIADAEAELARDVETATGSRGMTIVAFAILRDHLRETPAR